MTSPLLETKLHPPRRRRSVVARARLVERLGRGDDAALTLVSAPAGFGKSTLLTEWLAAEAAAGRAIAWVSLDEHDNDAVQFWSYVVAAFQHAVPGAGDGALALLQAQSAVEPVVATLINELTTIDSDVVLVLDDYHVIESTGIHELVTFLVEHAPAHTRVVIASRSDPPFPLARMRAGGDLVEVRAADLRFTTDEAAAYFTVMLGRELNADDVATLEARTEGWIAALQLAALSMEGRDDISSFVASFAGDDRFVVDYLAGEVLHRQPKPVRRFLLETCVLDRFTASLCDAVTESNDGVAMLQALDAGNLFLVPLDDRRDWFRYHHLFADVLRLRLLRETQEFVDGLHRRASTWFEHHDAVPEAISHALAGHDYERAADLLEPAIPELARTRQEAQLRTWLDTFPADVFTTRPVLSIGLVGARMGHGDVQGVADLLSGVERCLDAPASAHVVDNEQLSTLPVQIAVYRAALARVAGDIEGTVTHARHALEIAAPDDHFGRGGAAGFLALAAWTAGDLDAAYRWYYEAIHHFEHAGHAADAVGCTLALGDIRRAQGRADDALATYERGLQRAAEHGVARGTADLHVAIGEVLAERDDLAAAQEHLDASRELGEHAGGGQHAYRRRVVQARLREAHGDVAGALALLDEAERVYASDYFPNTRPIPAMKARLRLATGDIAAARLWATERGIGTDDELDYLQEYEHITLALLLLAEHERDAAEQLLDRLLEQAEAGGRAATAREIRSLQRDPAPAPTRPTAEQGLVDPLSSRELDVLRLLRSDLSGPDIARELMVSLNTMRTHTKNIYMKLGVNNRREAVTRAAQLGL